MPTPMVGGCSSLERTVSTGWLVTGRRLYTPRCSLLSVGSRLPCSAETPSVANLISTLAYQLSNVGNRREAVLLAQTAVTGAQRAATATSKALFGERAAWAQLVSAIGCRRNGPWRRFEREFSRGQSADDPEWVYWLTEPEVK